MSKQLSETQIKALSNIINNNMDSEKECLADRFRDMGDHDNAELIESDLTADEEIAEICEDYDETNTDWYQYWLLLPLIE